MPRFQHGSQKHSRGYLLANLTENPYQSASIIGLWIAGKQPIKGALNHCSNPRKPLKNIAFINSSLGGNAPLAPAKRWRAPRTIYSAGARRSPRFNPILTSARAEHL